MKRERLEKLQVQVAETPCSLTAFLSLAFICAGIMSVVVIVGLAVWLPIEIKQDGEIIKERNDLLGRVVLPHVDVQRANRDY